MKRRTHPANTPPNNASTPLMTIFSQNSGDHSSGCVCVFFAFVLAIVIAAMSGDLRLAKSGEASAQQNSRRMV